MPDASPSVSHSISGVRQRASRDNYADCLKAAAIVGVVCIHADIPFRDVFRFCVPAFLGLWAFYAEKALARRDRSDQFAYLRNRWVELVVPYLAWSLLYIAIFRASQWSDARLHTIVGGWFGGFGWAGQTYFVILLQLVVLIPWLRRLVTDRTLVPLIVAGSVFNLIAGYWLFDIQIVAKVNDRPFFYWLPFVFAGIALARGRFDGNPLWLALLAIALLCGAPFERRFTEAAYFSATVTLASLLLLAAAVIGDRKAADAGAMPRTTWLTKLAGVLGRNTFAIFVANPLLIEFVRRIGLTAALDSAVGPVAPILVAAIVIGGALCIGWALQTVRLGLLVGKAQE